MRVGYVEPFYRIVFPLELHAGNAFAAAPLLSEGVNGHPLDVIVFGNGDDDLVVGDQVFHIHFASRPR